MGTTYDGAPRRGRRLGMRLRMVGEIQRFPIPRPPHGDCMQKAAVLLRIDFDLPFRTHIDEAMSCNMAHRPTSYARRLPAAFGHQCPVAGTP